MWATELQGVKLECFVSLACSRWFCMRTFDKRLVWWVTHDLVSFDWRCPLSDDFGPVGLVNSFKWSNINDKGLQFLFQTPKPSALHSTQLVGHLCIKVRYVFVALWNVCGSKPGWFKSPKSSCLPYTTKLLLHTSHWESQYRLIQNVATAECAFQPTVVVRVMSRIEIDEATKNVKVSFIGRFCLQFCQGCSKLSGTGFGGILHRFAALK